jgi:quercetin dioxygenase-like cupin family protein
MIRKSGEGEAYRTPFGDTVTWLAGEEDTAGGFALMERVAPPGARSEPHSHKPMELFYVTEGEFDLTVGERTVRGGPGTMILAREGEPHGWATVGDTTGRMVLMLAPSPPRAYYRDVDALVRSFGDGPPDFRAVIALTKRHGIM